MSRRFRVSRSFSVVGVALLISAGFTLRAQQPAVSDPDRWEATIKKFEEQDRVNPPPRGEIVFTGASSIVRWNLPESFPDLKVINRGFGVDHLGAAESAIDDFQIGERLGQVPSHDARRAL